MFGYGNAQTFKVADRKEEEGNRGNKPFVGGDNGQNWENYLWGSCLLSDCLAHVTNFGSV